MHLIVLVTLLALFTWTLLPQPAVELDAMVVNEDPKR
jgi:hypothetical protein